MLSFNPTRAAELVNRALARCACSHEVGDSDCLRHPTCAECGADIAGHSAVAEAQEMARQLEAACAEVDRLNATQRIAVNDAVADRDALRAALGEALEIADAYIFAPELTQAGVSPGELAKFVSSIFNIDMTKPIKDKSRIAELRKLAVP